MSTWPESEYTISTGYAGTTDLSNPKKGKKKNPIGFASPKPKKNKKGKQ